MKIRFSIETSSIELVELNRESVGLWVSRDEVYEVPLTLVRGCEDGERSRQATFSSMGQTT